MSFGVLVYHKLQKRRGTSRAFISDDVSRPTFSASARGSMAAQDPVYRGFELLTVTTTIGMSATTVSLGITFDGEKGDVYYVALPTGAFGTALSIEDLGTSANATIRSVTHWNPPLLTPLRMRFPAKAYPGTNSTLYGYSGVDLEAISLGQVHHSVTAVATKIELTTAMVGANLFTGTRLDYSLVFGPQVVTQVANVMNVGQGWLPLADDGTFSIFVAQPSLFINNATFDFWSIQLGGTLSAN